MLILLLGCAPEPLDFCANSLASDYAPELRLSTYPDDHYTVVDPERATGRRVAISAEGTPAVAAFPENYQGWFDDLSTLDGFGLSAPIFLGFLEPLGDLEALDVQIWVLGETPELWPHTRSSTDADTTLMLQPLRALPSAAEVLVVVRSAPEESGCVAPSPVLKDLLDPEGRGLEPSAHSLRLRAALEQVEVPPVEVGAATLFTTQSALTQDLQVAEDIRARGASLEDLRCEDTEWGRQCEASMEAWDYRVEGVLPPGSAVPQSAYTLPVTLWLPPGEGPFPVIVCGHGLGGGREQCGAIQPMVAQAGLAVAAIDAVEHGAHPARSEAAFDLLAPLMIFALQVSPPGVEGLVLRDNFRQSAWDKLHLVLALQGAVDVDGDGDDDLDGARMGYAGVSLGAIMGPQILALAPELKAGWLAVGGARVTQIIQDGPEFSPLIELMAPPSMTEGDVDRAFPLLQTLMDPGDPAVWASKVQRERADGAQPPDLYLGAVLEDQIVPNSTNAAMAQGFQAPGIGREHFPVSGISFAPGSVSGNGPEGATLGFVQYDQVVRNGAWEDARHSHLHDSEQGLASLQAFFGAALIDGEAAVILDPDPE